MINHRNCAHPHTFHQKFPLRNPSFFSHPKATHSRFTSEYLLSLSHNCSSSTATFRSSARIMAKRVIKSRDGGYLIAVIGDEDTATGFLLAGVGDNQRKSGPNFFVVDPKSTTPHAIEEAFKKFTDREDIAIILINQYLADKIRPAISKFSAPIPAILEIPSKEHPYDATKDSILQRVRGMLGSS